MVLLGASNWSANSLVVYGSRGSIASNTSSVSISWDDSKRPFSFLFSWGVIGLDIAGIKLNPCLVRHRRIYYPCLVRHTKHYQLRLPEANSRPLCNTTAWTDRPTNRRVKPMESIHGMVSGERRGTAQTPTFTSYFTLVYVPLLNSHVLPDPRR